MDWQEDKGAIVSFFKQLGVLLRMLLLGVPQRRGLTSVVWLPLYRDRRPMQGGAGSSYPAAGRRYWLARRLAATTGPNSRWSLRHG